MFWYLKICASAFEKMDYFVLKLEQGRKCLERLPAGYVECQCNCGACFEAVKYLWYKGAVKSL